MTHLNFKHLQYFWATAHEGNLTRAAAKMNVSQSALSIQIQKLEEQLGHSLFERRARQLILTEVGSVVLRHADRIFSISDELINTLKDQGMTDMAVLRIGASATLSRNFQLSFIQPALPRTDVHITLHSGSMDELMTQLDAHKLDVILSNTLPVREAESSWIPHVIDEQPISVLATKGMVTPEDRNLSWQELFQSYPLVVPSRHSGMRTSFDALMDRNNIKPRILAETDDMAMLRLLIKSGAGLGVAPPIVVKLELQASELIEVCNVPELSETFFAVTPSRLFPNQLLDELIDEYKRVPAVA